MQRTLAKEGFENVIAKSNKKVTLVTFEDSRYRYSATGIIKAFGHTIKNLPGSTKKVYFIVSKYGVPLLTFESYNFQALTSRDKKQTVLIPHLALSRREARINKLVNHFRPINSSRFKSDIIIHPDMRMSLGEYDNPIAAQINIMPELRTQWFRGFFTSASIIFPLYNELEAWGNYVRLGPTSLNYIAHIGSGMFLYAAAGYFKGERYGAQTGLKKYLFSGKLMIDPRIGFSGFAMMDKGRIKYSHMDALTYSLSATYFSPALQLFFSLGAHRFIYKDYGMRMQVYRFFHDFQFGFWSVYSNAEFNGGFQFSLPLPPRRYRSRKTVRIRPASYFNWNYQAKRNTINGYRLRANEISDDLFIQYNPQYISSKLAFFSGR
jgi:hypothetical protein